MSWLRTVTRVVILTAALCLAACTNTSMQPPAGTTGSPSGAKSSSGKSGSSQSSTGQSGATQSGASQSGAGKSGSGQTASTPAGTGQPAASPVAGQAGTGQAGGAQSGPGQDPGAVFDHSLGDFDGEIGRERDAMAKAGQGSGRAADKQQSSDTNSVKTAGRNGDSGGPDVSVSGSGMGAGFPGGMGGIGAPGGIGGQTGGPPSTRAGAGSGGAGAKAGNGQGADQDADQGVGPDGEPGTPDDTAPGTGGQPAGSGGSGAAVETLPADIPRDGTGEDQVARQLREAALAEKDPAIRDALWNEYRKVMGMKAK